MMSIQQIIGDTDRLHRIAVLASRELHYLSEPALPLSMYLRLRRPLEPVSTIGVEWEYPTHINNRAVRRPAEPQTTSPPSLFWLALYRFAAYTEDGSGAHEIPLPPCGFVNPSEYLDCLGYLTAYIAGMALPLTDPSFRCGRHHHLSYRGKFDLGEFTKAFVYGSIFAAQRVFSSGDRVVAMFRNYANRYAVIGDMWSNHYNFIAYSRVDDQARLIEIRHPETIPLLSGLYTWLVYSLERGKLPVLYSESRPISYNNTAVTMHVDTVREIPQLFPQPLRDIAETWVEHILRRDTTDIIKAAEVKELFGDIIDSYLGDLMDMYDEIDHVVKICSGGYCIFDVLPWYTNIQLNSPSVSTATLDDFFHRI